MGRGGYGGYDDDRGGGMGERLREGWDNLRHGARDMLRGRGGGDWDYGNGDWGGGGDRDMGDRPREGWHTLRRGARDMFRR